MTFNNVPLVWLKLLPNDSHGDTLLSICGLLKLLEIESLVDNRLAPKDVTVLVDSDEDLRRWLFELFDGLECLE